MKIGKIYTCYGCPHFYADKGNKYNVKHCGQDHFKCPYFRGEGKPLGMIEAKFSITDFKQGIKVGGIQQTNDAILYERILEILKSAANATNGKNGG